MARKISEQLNTEMREVKRLLSRNYTKANVLIKSSARSALLIQKIYMLSIIKAVNNSTDNCMEATLYETELKKFLE